jgi:RIO kinase 1
MYRSIHDNEAFDPADELDAKLNVKNMPRPRKPARPRKDRRPAPALPAPIETVAPALQEEKLEMSYRASRYEEVWLLSSLEPLFHHRWFDDVLRMIKGGKEASVYLCAGNQTTGEDFVAAKVYRPRRFRNLRNDWLYREGRADLDETGHSIQDDGMLHAIRKRTRLGRELLHTSWLEYEFQTLRKLHEAGADVPKPFVSDSNTILMSYYGDDVMGAPTLNEVNLPAAEARGLFDRVVHNIDRMLSLGCIHGDLSAYNILYWEGEIAIIDFPQVISPDQNRSAFPIFERDVARICEYFQRQGVRNNPRKLAADLWASHQQRFMPLVDPKIIADDDGERDIWESLKNT